MASIAKLIGVYQECLMLCLDVKLSLEIRGGQKYFSFYRTHKPRDTRRREEWWERQRRGLESQASPKLRFYSEAVKNQTTTGNPVLELREKLPELCNLTK